MHTKTRSRTAEGAESSSDIAVRGTLTCNHEVREDSGMNLKKKDKQWAQTASFLMQNMNKNFSSKMQNTVLPCWVEI